MEGLTQNNIQDRDSYTNESQMLKLCLHQCKIHMQQNEKSSLCVTSSDVVDVALEYKFE